MDLRMDEVSQEIKVEFLIVKKRRIVMFCSNNACGIMLRLSWVDCIDSIHKCKAHKVYADLYAYNGAVKAGHYHLRLIKDALLLAASIILVSTRMKL